MRLGKYSRVQNLAKQVLADLCVHISESSSEESIAKKAKKLLEDKGITETWYHNVPALVLLGSRSCLSVSGKEYVPSVELVGNTNLITVDLSPSSNNIWGDCARSFVVEDGRVTNNPRSTAFIDGMNMVSFLHQEMRKFVSSDTKFSELYEYGNQLITKSGWENLDFRGNLGHSIETSPERRRFIDGHCKKCLGDVGYFTFEPHIRKKGSVWGFKHENIYYFDDNSEINDL